MPIANNRLKPSIVYESKFKHVSKQMLLQQKKSYDVNTGYHPEIEKGTVVRVRDGKDCKPTAVLSTIKRSS